jgi:hypothetical protein
MPTNRQKDDRRQAEAAFADTERAGTGAALAAWSFTTHSRYESYS